MEEKEIAAETLASQGFLLLLQRNRPGQGQRMKILSALGTQSWVLDGGQE
jgi:hypothetical protein